MATFFASSDSHFLPVPEDGDIELEPFLRSARQLPPFFDLMGSAFKPVKNDIQGNIDKLQKQLDANKDNYKKAKEMLLFEKEAGTNTGSNSGTVALLWLKRGMQYICLFLKQIVEDSKNEKKKETKEMVNNAYEQTLKKYHGFIVKKVFSVVSYAAPSRESLLKTLAYGKDGMEDEVIQDMDTFLQPMASNTEVIHQMYVDLELESDAKV